MMNEDRSLAVIDAQAIEIAPTQTVEQFEKQLAEFREFTQRNLRQGVDYGVIPGTDKPTLLKPGAEKVMRWNGFVVDTEILPTSRTDILEGVLDYHLQGTVRHVRSGARLGTVHATANSEERRYKNARPPQTIADQENTILKMADKRVWVAAALLCTGASEAYTQDMEDAETSRQSQAAPGTPKAADSPPGCPGYCVVHMTAFKLIPAGTSKKTGKAYNAFWACPERGCREDATPFPPETPQDVLDEVAGGDTPPPDPNGAPAPTSEATAPNPAAVAVMGILRGQGKETKGKQLSALATATRALGGTLAPEESH